MATISQPPLWQHLLDESLQHPSHMSGMTHNGQNVDRDARPHLAYTSTSPVAESVSMYQSPMTTFDVLSPATTHSRRFSAVFTPNETSLWDDHELLNSLHPPLNDPALESFAIDPTYLASQQELRSLMFNTAHPAPSSRATSPLLQLSSPAGSSTTSVMSSIVNSTKRVEYLKNYIDVVARWLDMFDEDRTFGVQLVALAQHSPALLYAILGISARHMERKARICSSFDSLELYQEAIKLLAPLLQTRDSVVVATCVILCCMEMMSASAQDWRKHLEGCASLLDALDINGLSGGLEQAVFWCFVRMDLCGALISDGTESPLLRIDRWLPDGITDPEIRSLFRSSGTADVHANHAVYLCARTCHLLAQRTKYNELGEENGCEADAFAQQWQWLWDELNAWFSDRPVSMLPLEVCELEPFPRILFGHYAAISSTQLAHTAMVLLLNSQPAAIQLHLSAQSSIYWHARRICGISATNQHEGCLNNALQPLWIAGLHLGGRGEHASLVRLIRSIEMLTGWGFSWRIPDLEESWGYKLLDG